MSAETDGQRLDRLLGDRNRAEFARAHGIAGGGSMISQHVSGNRPISIEAAVGYSRGLGLPLEAISTEVAARVRDAAERLSPALAQPPATAPSTQPTQISLADALPVVLGRLAAGLGDYRAGQVLQALQSATRPGAPLEDIERDLLQWLSEPPGSAAPPAKRQIAG